MLVLGRMLWVVLGRSRLRSDEFVESMWFCTDVRLVYEMARNAGC